MEAKLNHKFTSPQQSTERNPSMTDTHPTSIPTRRALIGGAVAVGAALTVGSAAHAAPVADAVPGFRAGTRR
jgi:hypothetical protein